MTEADDLQSIEKLGQVRDSIVQELRKTIVGMDDVIDEMMIAIFARGHCLLVGVPGLAKTLLVSSLAKSMSLDFKRIQFTPDLLPGDVTGTDVFRPQLGTFEFQAGPIFHNLVLADEINRAPAKVQSALLEAMAERQVSVGATTYPLPALFLVMATQNPIEQEGTYPLPEAQLDRFLMHVRVDYPNSTAEREILKLARREASSGEAVDQPEVSEAVIFAAREEVLKLHMSDAVEEYIVQLIMATRQPEAYDKELASWIEYGASPRATIGLDRCARAHAWLLGRDFVSPDDVKAMAYDVLRHRLVVSYDGEIAGVTADDVIDKLLDLVPVA